MKLPSVYPLTSPSSHSTSKITAIVKSILASCAPLEHAACPVLWVAGYVLSHRIACMKDRSSWFRRFLGFRGFSRFRVLLVLFAIALLQSAPQAQMDPG